MKKKGAVRLQGYCPFSACTESRYSNLYHDTWLGRRGLGSARGPRHGRACATIRPSEGHDKADLCAGRAAARTRAWPSQRACHDTNFVSWLGAAFVSQYGCDTGCDTATVRHDTTLGAARHAVARDKARAHGLGAGCVAIQPATRPARLATRPSSATIRPGRGPRHDPADATTQSPARAIRAAWAQCARSASCLLVCLILFPSLGIIVVQHCNTVGIHRSFPQGVV